MHRPDISTEHIAQFHLWMDGNTLSDKAKLRLRCILQYLEHDQSMDDVAAMFGTTPNALLRWLDRFDPTDPSTLEDKSRRPHAVRSTQLSADVVALIHAYRKSAPKTGKEEISVALQKEHGVDASPSAIGRVIERDCLYFADSPLHMRKRLRARMAGAPLAAAIPVMTADTPVTMNATVVTVPTINRKKWLAGTIVALLVSAMAFGFAMSNESVGASEDATSTMGTEQPAEHPILRTLLKLLGFAAEKAYAEDPGPIVNTESFQIIDDGDSTTDVELRFGDLTGEKLYWNVPQSRFQFSDDLHLDGNLTGSGGLAIELNIRAKGNITFNSDNDAADAVMTFGNSTLPQTLSFIHNTQKFRFSASLDIVGTMSGYALTVSGLRNCDSIDTDADGNFACGTDAEGEGGPGGGMDQVDGDARYVNQSGDTMTGSLTVRGTISGSVLKASNMTVSGAVVYSSGNTLKQSAKGLSGQLLVSQGTGAPKWVTPVGGMAWFLDGTQSIGTSIGAKVIMPMNVTLTSVSMAIKGTPTGTALIVNIKKDGSSIFSTRPQINSGALLGGGNAVFSTTKLTEDSIITLDVDQIGSTFAGSGLTVILKGVREY